MLPQRNEYIMCRCGTAMFVPRGSIEDGHMEIFVKHHRGQGHGPVDYMFWRYVVEGSITTFGPGENFVGLDWTRINPLRSPEILE